MIGRFLILSLTLHAAAAALYISQYDSRRISIEVPVLEVSFARTRLDLSTAHPSRSGFGSSKMSSVPNRFRSIPDRSYSIPVPAAPTESTRLASTEPSTTPDSSGERATVSYRTNKSAVIGDVVKFGENGDAGPAERANHLMSHLRGALDRHFVYPPLARRHGWEGTVQVGLRMDTHGQLGALRVLRSSGYAVLDDDALQTFRRIAALPDARGWLDGRVFETVLPVIYRLTDA